MSFNTYPQNPFPSNSEMLQKLDEVTKAIDNMPTFTSNDKAFLNELPAFPSTDGVKVLTATTESGETSLSYEEVEKELPTEPSADGVKVLTATTESGETVLSWEEVENELPAEPSADGVKVLTATTESGETVLSWEEPTLGVLNYSLTEQNTGQKWIDGKDIYFKTIDFGALPNNTTKSVSSGLTNEFIVKMDAFAYKSDAFYPLPFVSVTTLNDCIRSGYNIGNHTVDIVTSGDKSAISAYVTLYYTKTESEV